MKPSFLMVFSGVTVERQESGVGPGVVAADVGEAVGC